MVPSVGDLMMVIVSAKTHQASISHRSLLGFTLVTSKAIKTTWMWISARREPSVSSMQKLSP